MKTRVDGDLRELMNRMKRIEGQARGIQKMLEEGRDCEEVILQLAAMRAALSKVAMAMMAGHLEECLLKNSAAADVHDAIARAKKIFMKFS